MTAQPKITPTAAPASKVAPRPFDDLDVVEGEHSLLVKDLKSLCTSPGGIERVRQFLSRAAATGTILDAREDRASVQGLMNFWTAKLASAARAEDGGVKNSDLVKPKFEETLLAEFDPSTVRKAVADADRWLATLPPKDESMARCVLLRLARLGADGRTFEPVSTTKAALYDVFFSNESVDRAVSGLAKIGVIHITKGETPEAERVHLRSKELLTSWPTYKKWLDARRAFREMAEQWNREGRPADRLLKWKDLEEAMTYQNRNEAEQRFIEACRYEDRRKNERNRFWKFFGVLAIPALAGLIVSLTLSTRYREVSEQLQKKVVELEAKKKAAEDSQRETDKINTQLRQATDQLTREKTAAEKARKNAEDLNEEVRESLGRKLEMNKELGKDKELNTIILRIAASKEQDFARQTQAKLDAHVENDPIVSPALARDPYLKGQWRLWKNGTVLAVRFLDGDDNVKALVKKYAAEWSQFANLKFDFDSQATDAPIRLTFAQPGSWSAIGIDALTVAADQPTINLGQVRTAVNEEDAARVIRHEFGHVIGLIHEQENPNANIRWNKQAVIQYYGSPPNNWPLSVIQETIFDVAPKFENPEYRAFDPKSIMMFPVPAGLAEGLVVEWNTKFSEGDKKFAAELYPRP